MSDVTVRQFIDELTKLIRTRESIYDDNEGVFAARMSCEWLAAAMECAVRNVERKEAKSRRLLTKRSEKGSLT